MDHVKKIAAALTRIQRARMELNEACAEISSVRGLVSVWERLGKLSTIAETLESTLRNLQESPRLAKLNDSKSAALAATDYARFQKGEG